VTETAQWIDADGVATDLEVSWDVSGRFMPPIVFEEDGIPQQPGLRLRAVRHDVRTFMLTLWITAADGPSLRLAMRDLVTKMDPHRGPGAIVFTTPVGDLRQITCSYASGLEVGEKLGESSGPTVQIAAVTFRAHDPYWADVADTSAVFTTGALPNFFPFFPLRLSSSQVVVDTTIDNLGDLDAWPLITITGPGSVINAANLTTGLYLDFGTGSIGTGQSVIIDTRPGAKTVVMQDGLNVFAALSATSALWSLVPGNNAIRLTMSGADPITSQISFSYRCKYLSV
jgi:hypothetical protein